MTETTPRYRRTTNPEITPAEFKAYVAAGKRADALPARLRDSGPSTPPERNGAPPAQATEPIDVEDERAKLRKPEDNHKREVQKIREFMEHKDRGGRCYVLSQGHRLQGSAGIPDLMLFLPDQDIEHFAFCEVKVGPDVLSEKQAEFQQHAWHSSLTHIVGGLEDVKAWAVLSGETKGSNVETS